jgi:UDP-2,4-diacetamido-2,4,6-trideoxy-beta-L-altropyranose hydrolase
VRIAIRADASSVIGSGHVRRCVSLAHALRQSGAHVEFITRALGTDAAARIQAQGFPVHQLPAPGEPAHEGTPPLADGAGVGWQQDADETVRALRRADWVVVDHYSFDARWHKHVGSKLGARVAIIDDLADRPLHGDVVIDGSLAADADHGAKYRKRIVNGSVILGGPHYALLAPPYLHAPPCTVSNEVRSIGIFMGGADPAGLSEPALRACREHAGFTGPIELVTTQANPRVQQLKALAARWPHTTVAVDIPELSAFFSRHSLQIGAGGSASWERCCVGAPTVALVGGAGQIAVVPQLARAGALATLPTGQEPTAEAIGALVRALMDDTAWRRALAGRARELVDGRGAQRVALKLTAETVRVRRAEREDSDLVYRWRNDPVTRIVSRNPEEIGPNQHAVWLGRTLADHDKLLLLGEVGDIPVGVVRFDRHNPSTVEVSIYLDPALHGLGLGAALLRAGEEAARIWAGKNLAFAANVLGGNTLAKRMFEAQGYRFKGALGRKRA